MLESLLSPLLTALANLADILMMEFMQALGYGLDPFRNNFQVAQILYTVLQSVALGFVLCFAVLQLLRFFIAGNTERGESPLRILGRSALAVALIYFGNYFLELIVNLFSFPYKTILDVDAVIFSFVDMETFITNMIENSATELVSGLVALLACLILGGAILWNIVKLVLEVAERTIMVGVLVYTSPLAWSTLGSSDTAPIFQKWFSMFFGQCILMLLNVWSLEVVLSVFTFNETTADTFYIRLILGLAMCKIAQRLDSYIQQLGVNVATTGGSMIDSLMGIGYAMRSMTGTIGKSRASRETILGERPGSAADGGPALVSPWLAGGVGAAAGAAKGAWQSFKRGDSASEVGKAAEESAAANANIISRSKAGLKNYRTAVETAAVEKAAAEQEKAARRRQPMLNEIRNEGMRARSALQQQPALVTPMSKELMEQKNERDARRFQAQHLEESGAGDLLFDSSTGQIDYINDIAQANGVEMEWKYDEEKAPVEGTDYLLGTHASVVALTEKLATDEKYAQREDCQRLVSNTLCENPDVAGKVFEDHAPVQVEGSAAETFMEHAMPGHKNMFELDQSAKCTKVETQTADHSHTATYQDRYGRETVVKITDSTYADQKPRPDGTAPMQAYGRFAKSFHFEKVDRPIKTDAPTSGKHKPEPKK